jgi:hypothetical protein
MPAFFWGVTLTIVAKLWLTSQIRIAPVFGDHDAENYVEHARDVLAGAWFGGYTDLTLIKEPFYPLYLALVQESGLTLTLANLLLYAGACVIACLAIRPLIRNGIILAGVFAVLFFNPMTYAWEAWMAMRSEVNNSLALAATACAIAILVRRRASVRRLIPWWAGLGVSFAAFWLTREEAIWLVPSLLVISIAYVLSIRRDPGIRMKLLGLAIPVAIWGLSGATIATINEHVYGWNTVVETKAPEFVSAYNALARIVPAKEEPLIPVPRSSREIAYRVSPAARELEPALEGPLGQAWTDVVCNYQVHICDDIAGSFFVWALRDAVAAAGHYSSGRDARDFYIKLASELDKACDSGEIRCRNKALTIFPNPTWSQLPDIVANFRAGVAIVTTFSQFSLAHVVVPPNPVLDAKYAYIVGSISQDRNGFEGWLATDRPMRIAVEDPTGVKPVDGAFGEPSADVAAALARAGHAAWDDRNARFSFMSDCDEECFIVATDSQNRQVRIPLMNSVRDFATPHAIYHLGVIQTRLLTYDNNLKQRILGFIARLYEVGVPLWVLLGALLLAARAIRAAIKRRLTVPSVPDVLSIAVMAGGGFLILILAALTVSYSAGFSPEYLGSFVPLMLFALGAATALDALLAYRLIRLRRTT